MSSMWTKPSSSSGSICMRRFTSCGLRRSGSDCRHSRQKRRFRPMRTCSWPLPFVAGLVRASTGCWMEEHLESGPATVVPRFRGALESCVLKYRPRLGSSWLHCSKACCRSSTVLVTSSLKQCSIASIGISTPGSPRAWYAMRRFRSACMMSGATSMKGLHSMKPSSFSWADVRSKCMSHSSSPKPGRVAPRSRATSWWGNSPKPSSSAASKTLASSSDKLVRGGTMSPARPAAFSATRIAWTISWSCCPALSSISMLTLSPAVDNDSCCSSDSELSVGSTTLSSALHIGGG
mmetsp:Transcript_102023/g.304414  ORF Transcript_102023/g.304414 Transcript_102023/m.304414 type:complete len:292 (+) Transcript_102023:1260-2135(+)